MKVFGLIGWERRVFLMQLMHANDMQMLSSEVSLGTGADL